MPKTRKAPAASDGPDRVATRAALPAKASPAETGSTKGTPVKPALVKPALVKPALVKRAPAKRVSVKPATAEAGPAKLQHETSTGDRFLAEQRAELVSERAAYVEQAESLRIEAEQLAEDMGPGDIQFDEESGEGDTLNVERERDLALSAQARGAVDEIDLALHRMDIGTYGVCERCGVAIPRARLKALPYASMCVACKSGGLSRR